MNEQLSEILLNSVSASKLKEIELIQNLWSGYGSLNRVYLDDKSVILKLISFPIRDNHPRGWNTDISHQRKKKSYQVEMNWYKNFSHHVPYSYTPKHLSSGVIEEQSYLILEDLEEFNFYPSFSTSKKMILQTLEWLANFHATYLFVAPQGLWDTGTYWHLETRPDELRALTDLKLKKAAPLIDKKLNSAQFKTIVHGDAKVANFLFNENQVAGVDFQYVGGGVGIKDVAYFLSSVYNEQQLHQHETECLNHYFDKLTIALTKMNRGDVAQAVADEWRELYPVAWCDFYRFLQGWSPGHPKINTYSESMKEKVIQWL